MNSLEALQQIGVNARDMSESDRRSLDINGYFIIPVVLTKEQCGEMAAEVDRIANIEGEKAGSEVSQEAGTLRVSNIFNKSAVLTRFLRSSRCWLPRTICWENSRCMVPTSANRARVVASSRCMRIRSSFPMADGVWSIPSFVLTP